MIIERAPRAQQLTNCAYDTRQVTHMEWNITVILHVIIDVTCATEAHTVYYQQHMHQNTIKPKNLHNIVQFVIYSIQILRSAGVDIIYVHKLLHKL